MGPARTPSATAPRSKDDSPPLRRTSRNKAPTTPNLKKARDKSPTSSSSQHGNQPPSSSTSSRPSRDNLSSSHKTPLSLLLSSSSRENLSARRRQANFPVEREPFGEVPGDRMHDDLVGFLFDLAGINESEEEDGEEEVPDPAILDNSWTPMTLRRQSHLDLARFIPNVPEDERLHDLLQWLNKSDCTSRHRELGSLHLAGTCTWLHATTQYKVWRSSLKNSLLWLQGKPGSGKSVMAYSIIEEFKKAKNGVIAYFYCDFRNRRSTEPTEVMSSILGQILNNLRRVPLNSRASSLIQDIIDKRDSGGVFTNRLPYFVLHAVALSRYQPLVVIDALDECEDINRLLDALVLWSGLGRIRVFVTSRPLWNIQRKIPHIPIISIDKFEREVSKDISLFVQSQLDLHGTWPKEMGIELKKEIHAVLCNNAEGMFLWVKCQIEVLKECSDISEIRRVLDRLPVPPGLHETYERILVSIDKRKSRRRIVRRTLSWLIAAFHSIELRQLLEALMIDLDQRIMNADELRKVVGFRKSVLSLKPQALEAEIRTALLSVLGSLVTHDEATDQITFSHFSIKDYLTGHCTLPRHHIDEQDAHEEVVATCACYISSCLRGALITIYDEPAFQISHTTQVSPEDLEASPLLQYVLSNSFFHLSNLGPDNEDVLGDILALESDIQEYPAEWGRLREMASLDHSWPSEKHDFAIYVLVAFAPDWLLRTFLAHQPLSSRLSDHPGANPLIYAVHFHKIDHARILLSHGADPNRKGWLLDDSSQVFPLDVAVRVEDQRAVMMDLLLQCGASIAQELFVELVSEPHNFALPIVRKLIQTDEFVEWVERYQGLPLSLHPFLSPETFQLEDDTDLLAIIWRLVQMGFDYSMPDSSGKTAVHLAVEGGHLSVVEYLISMGAQLPTDIFLTLSESRSPSARRAKMARYLLRLGADVHSVSPVTGDTALHMAIKNETHSQRESDLLEIVMALVNSGCHLHARNFEKHTPLHLAVLRGHVSVVKYLARKTIPLPRDLSDTLSRAPPSVQNEIRDVLMNSGVSDLEDIQSGIIMP